jgi:integrase/recombinase XerC
MARQNRPWFRKSKNGWYVWVEGNLVNLKVKGEGKEREALKSWHRVMAGRDDGTPPEPTPTPLPSPSEKQQKQTPKPPTQKRQKQTPDKDGPTVSDVIESFMEDARDRVEANTARVYAYFLNGFKETHGAVKACDLAPTKVEKYARRMGWSDTTQSNFIGSVVSAFKYAVRDRMIVRSPLEGIKAPKRESRGAEAVIDPADHARLLEKATPTFKLFLHVVHATGARPGEVAKITAENFDPDGGVVVLTQHKTKKKTGRDRVLYLTPDAVELLKKQREKYPTGHLLRTKYGRPWKPVLLVRAMDSTRKKAGVKGVTLYHYRHTAATDLLLAGVPDSHVAEVLGHKGTRTLHAHYSHLQGKADVMRAALGQVRGGRGEA